MRGMLAGGPFQGLTLDHVEDLSQVTLTRGLTDYVYLQRGGVVEDVIIFRTAYVTDELARQFVEAELRRRASAG